MSTLSVIIPSHNDQSETVLTVRSIRETAGSEPEIVVVDDCSLRGSPVLTPDCGQCTLVRTQRRIGVGPARHLGAMRARGEYLLFVDSHMRFHPGWYAAAMSKIVGRPTTIHCGACYDFGSPDKPYMRGAKWNFYGPDAFKPQIKQVFECIWNRNPPDAPPKSPHIPLPNDSPIPAIMGAVYYVPRELFFKLNPLRFLRSWAGDEQSLSLKVWLSGGECRLLNTHPVAHRFQQGNKPYPLPYRLRMTDTVYNKLFLLHTSLPADKAAILISKFSRDAVFSAALRRLQDDWHLVEIEREYNRQLFTRSFDSFLQQFNIPFPVK